SLFDGEKSQTGTPYLKEISVTGKVKCLTPGPKVIVFKFRRRKSSHVKNGHRQKYTEVHITKINTSQTTSEKK
ncbi:MAG: 50S ribosomal protein L21, partial [Planctomycetota bacterium]